MRAADLHSISGTGRSAVQAVVGWGEQGSQVSASDEPAKDALTQSAVIVRTFQVDPAVGSR